MAATPATPLITIQGASTTIPDVGGSRSLKLLAKTVTLYHGSPSNAHREWKLRNTPTPSSASPTTISTALVFTHQSLPSRQLLAGTAGAGPHLAPAVTAIRPKPQVSSLEQQHQHHDRRASRG
jgi:hypothetical protein